MASETLTAIRWPWQPKVPADEPAPGTSLAEADTNNIDLPPDGEDAGTRPLSGPNP